MKLSANINTPGSPTPSSNSSIQSPPESMQHPAQLAGLVFLILAVKLATLFMV